MAKVRGENAAHYRGIRGEHGARFIEISGGDNRHAAIITRIATTGEETPFILQVLHVGGVGAEPLLAQWQAGAKGRAGGILEEKELLRPGGSLLRVRGGGGASRRKQKGKSGNHRAKDCVGHWPPLLLFHTLWYGMCMARPNRRTSRDDWIKLGLSLLGRHGPEALTLERLTAAAKKTRGSFYHHFEDHQAFVKALGAYWLTVEIEAKIAEIDTLTFSGKRREALAHHAAAIDHAMERELRRLGASEPAIAAIVARADEMRIAYLVRLFRSELGLEGAEALARARVQHCYFVGAQMVFPEAEPRFLLNLQKKMGAALWRK